MGFWIFIGIAVVAFIIGDAFFDLSFKISRWWKMRVVSVWERVGTRVRDAVEKTHPAQSTWDGQTPARTKIDWGAFLWKARLPIGFVVVFALVVSLSQGWLSFADFGKSRDTIRAERDIAQSETHAQETINERDTDIASIRQEMALMRQDLRTISQRGRNALAAATPAHEAQIDPGLVAAWRSTLDELCVARADGARADTCSR